MWAEDEKNQKIPVDVKIINLSVLDHSCDLHFINKKLEALKIIETVEKQLSNFNKLYFNLELIETYFKKQYHWKSDEAIKLYYTLQIIKDLDEKVENLSVERIKSNHSLESFIMNE